MSERPPWVRVLHTFVHDEIIDDKYGYPADGSADGLLEEVAAAVDEILCRAYGHEIVDDHCGKPEHRYCPWCGQNVQLLAR